MSKKSCNGKVCGWFVMAVLGCATAGCRRSDFVGNSAPAGPGTVAAVAATEEAMATPSACDMILAPHAGAGRLDGEIARVQAKLRGETNTLPCVEKLGWLFVAKARESFDPGYYKLAEQCALCLDSHQPHAAEALLLRGHVLQSLHRFKEAEDLARELVAQRGRSFDYGLLGDVVMEQGRLDEAAEAYQRMVDEKPDMEAYARISYLRWLKGDLAGATEVMRLAVSAASPNAPESAAWVNTRLALLEFQQGNVAQSQESCRVALGYQRDYAPALLLQGRLLLADGKAADAVDVLQRAAQMNPLPDYQWTLSEALHAAKRLEEAAAVEAKLLREGAAADPRTFALYLASRGESLATALELAREELNTRRDVFTHDALAWALAANGKIEEARSEMQQALSQGTQDARLLLHAAVIAAKAGQQADAQRWQAKLAPLTRLLLPSEQRQFQALAADAQRASLPNAASSPLVGTLFTPAN